MNEKTKLIRKYDKQAGMYAQRNMSRTESEWRERLVRDASGNVLEIACGAGANFPYYPEGVKVTAVDFSEAMLNHAAAAARKHGVDATFRRGDVEMLEFPQNTFDTIVSTLSMCGYERPDKVLASLNRWAKPGGRILMLEHGLSKYGLAAAVQRTLDPLFRRVSGCHFDRDIPGLLAASPLRVIRMERHMLGAVCLIWAEPSKPD